MDALARHHPARVEVEGADVEHVVEPGPGAGERLLDQLVGPAGLTRVIAARVDSPAGSRGELAGDEDVAALRARRRDRQARGPPDRLRLDALLRLLAEVGDRADAELEPVGVRPGHRDWRPGGRGGREVARGDVEDLWHPAHVGVERDHVDDVVDRAAGRLDHRLEAVERAARLRPRVAGVERVASLVGADLAGDEEQVARARCRRRRERLVPVQAAGLDRLPAHRM